MGNVLRVGSAVVAGLSSELAAALDYDEAISLYKHSLIPDGFHDGLLNGFASHLLDNISWRRRYANRLATKWVDDECEILILLKVAWTPAKALGNSVSEAFV